MGLFKLTVRRAFSVKLRNGVPWGCDGVPLRVSALRAKWHTDLNATQKLFGTNIRSVILHGDKPPVSIIRYADQSVYVHLGLTSSNPTVFLPCRIHPATASLTTLTLSFTFFLLI